MTPHDVVQRVLDGRPPAPACAEGRAFAAANIALVKYWGKRDETLNLPRTDSLSISLGPLGAHTRARPAARDRFSLNGRLLDARHPAARRLARYLDLFRARGVRGFEVSSRSNLPMAAGLASSASGFAALVLALNDLFGWRLPDRGLSILARLGSGSACRSLRPGFVHWRAGRRADGLDSYASVLPEPWPDLRVGLVMIHRGPKETSSRDGMRHTRDTSPLYRAWPALVRKDIAAVRAAIRARAFEPLGRTAEGNALAMHATMLAARPALLYWRPETLAAVRRVAILRQEGIPVYTTIDAGPNVKLLFPATEEKSIVRAFPGLRIIRPFDAFPAA